MTCTVPSPFHGIRRYGLPVPVNLCQVQANGRTAPVAAVATIPDVK